jgi:hypothetical protein
MNYLCIFEVNHRRPLYPLVDNTHLRLVNSDRSNLAKSCIFIDCTLGNSSKHVHE